jgi:hypothetical protein
MASDGTGDLLGDSGEKPSPGLTEEVTGLLLFFGGSQPLLVLRFGKESARLAVGATFAWIAACLLIRMWFH